MATDSVTVPTASTEASLGIRKSRSAYGFLLPWLIGLVVITAGPMLASLVLSFTDYRLAAPGLNWVGFANYHTMFTDDPQFRAAALVTAKYVIISVPLQLAFALGVAVFLDKGIRGLSIYRSVYYLPSLLGSSVAVAVVWRRFFSSDGLFVTVGGWFGIELGSWISDPDRALITLMILNVWTFGSPMVIFLAGLRQIPAELTEAASVDGAGAVRRFRHVTLPMLSPVLFFNFILQLIHAFQAFTPAYVISAGSGGPSNSTLFYTLYIFQQGFANFNMGYASAMAWVLFIVIGIFTAANFLVSRYWVHYES
jgi:multiple sugar transport system permease protein